MPGKRQSTNTATSKHPTDVLRMLACAILKSDSIAHCPTQLILFGYNLSFLLNSSGDFFAHTFRNTHGSNSPRLRTPHNEVTTTVALFHQVLDQLCGLINIKRLE